jgi:TRAP-type mannitol/chloroaromatic compound transport system substrate-binding protein
MQTHIKPGDPFYDSLQRAVSRANDACSGRLSITLHPAGAVTTEGEEMLAASRGAIDIGGNASSFLEGTAKVFAPFLQVSGGLTSTQFLYWMQYDGINQYRQLLSKYLPDAEYLYTSPMLGEVFLHSAKPITSVADLKSLKTRGTGDGIEILANMGTPTVFLSSGEIYEAMQRGVIDAFESNSFFVDYGRGHHEVAKYHYTSYSRAPMTELTAVVYRPKWEAISPDLQQAVRDAFTVEQQLYLAEMISNEGIYAQKFIDYGCIIEPLPKEVEDAYLAEARKFYTERRAADAEYDQVLGSMLSFKDQCEALGIR